MANTTIPVELSSTPGIVDNSNATAITIDSSENVGIGTGSPAAKLHIESAATNEAIRINTSTGYNAGINYYVNDTIKWTAQVLGDGTDAYRFYNFVAASEAMRIDSSGNVGIGCTPDAWSGYSVLQIGTSGALSASEDITFLSANAYSSASGWKYVTTDEASLYQQIEGGHIWYGASSGSADAAISWAERMRIDSSGYLLVGTTSVPSGGTDSQAVFKGNNSLGVQGASTTNTGDIRFYNPSGAKYWQISSNQTDWYFADADFSHYAILAQNMTAWTFGSDRRLKENIEDISYGLDAVKAMQPRSFRFKSTGVETIGFIAQELAEVIPEAVSGEEIEYLESDSPQEKAGKSMGVSKETLIPVLVKAIQEQQTIIESLTARITALES